MSRSRRASLLLAILGSAPFPAALARAHINLIEPAARAPGRPDTTLSRGPCGQRENARREDGVRVFRPGQTIDVVWDVYVQHVSYFRIAFDADGDDSFSARPSMPRDPAADDPTALAPGEDEFILDYIQDRSGDVDRVERRVTLPDVECERCTLQVIQFTYGLPLANATYHQCVDLVLDATAPGGDDEAGGSAGAAGAGVGAAGGDGAAAASDAASALDPGAPGAADEGAGCSLARAPIPSRAGWSALFPIAGAVALALGRGRRRAHGAGSDTIHCRKIST